jgi:hypothetical protein
MGYMKISGWSEGLWWNRTTIEKAETTASPNITGQEKPEIMLGVFEMFSFLIILLA